MTHGLWLLSALACTWLPDPQAPSASTSEASDEDEDEDEDEDDRDEDDRDEDEDEIEDGPGDDPPSQPGVEIAPELPTTRDDLLCLLTEPSEDPEGEDVDYQVSWSLGGAPYGGPTQTSLLAGDTVPAEVTEPGQRWACSITPNDGGLIGEAGRATADVIEGTIVDGVQLLLADGVHTYDALEVINGGVLVLQGEVELRLHALFIDEDSSVYGRGQGHPPSFTFDPGEGPGGGWASSTASGGGGGGGHAGSGGRGGGDVGTQGPAYGGDALLQALAGSAGGSGRHEGDHGGAGGAGLWIQSERIEIHGAVDLRGESGASSASLYGGGGGSGGSLLLQGDQVVIGGILNVSGGDGADGTTEDQTHDSGGGGSAGRIKVLYDSSLDDAGATYVALGGEGGRGLGANGQPGSAGTVTIAQEPF